MRHGEIEEHPTHGLAHVNAVMAYLTVITGTAVEGTVRSDKLFKPDAPVQKVLLLEVVTAVQTEVSLSIFASDPLIAQASRGFGAHISTDAPDEERIHLVDETDEIIQDWVSHLTGKGQVLTEIGDLILARGEVSLSEIKDAYFRAPSTF